VAATYQNDCHVISVTERRNILLEPVYGHGQSSDTGHVSQSDSGKRYAVESPKVCRLMLKRPVANRQSRSLSWRKHKFGVTPSIFQKGQLRDGPSDYLNWALRPMRSESTQPRLQQVQNETVQSLCQTNFIWSRHCRQTAVRRDRQLFIRSFLSFCKFPIFA